MFSKTLWIQSLRPDKDRLALGTLLGQGGPNNRLGVRSFNHFGTAPIPVFRASKWRKSVDAVSDLFRNDSMFLEDR
jgi:hypothetical protein